MKFSLMIHGGAGLIADKQRYNESLRTILEQGHKLLAKETSALDVAEQCVRLLENDPLFNAGRGPVLNEYGLVDMDAAIMDGSALNAGSVAGIKNVKNPISLARLVMERTPHVMLIADGAMEFAKQMNVQMEVDEYFITPQRIKQLKEAQAKGELDLDHSSQTAGEKKLGTVGCVVCDTHGNLAAATSTGGIVNKKFGRIGDSPIVGAGVYADNQTCAVSATGFGEYFIRTALSKSISDLIRYKKLTAQEAADEGIAYLVSRVQGIGGVIVIDKDGRCGFAYSTPTMIFGSVDQSGEIKIG